jgi:hypothetical protein
MLTQSHEEMKVSVAICLGKIGTSVPELYKKIISSHISEGKIASYYFLSLKEFLSIVYHEGLKLEQSVASELFAILNSNASNNNDNIRSIVGESLGLIINSENSYFEQYWKSLNSNDKIIRSTALLGLKFIQENSRLEERHLEDLANVLLKGLVDEDLECKRNSFNSLMNFVHHHSQVIRKKTGDLMSIFKTNYKIDEKMIEVTDIGGGMKIKNDKNLSMRKSIHSTMKILLSKVPEKLQIAECTDLVLYGLSI